MGKITSPKAQCKVNVADIVIMVIKLIYHTKLWYLAWLAIFKVNKADKSQN